MSSLFGPVSSLVVGYFSVPTSPEPLIIRLRINFVRTNSTWESGRALPFNVRSESTEILNAISIVIVRTFIWQNIEWVVETSTEFYEFLVDFDKNLVNFVRIFYFEDFYKNFVNSSEFSIWSIFMKTSLGISIDSDRIFLRLSSESSQYSEDFFCWDFNRFAKDL